MTTRATAKDAIAAIAMTVSERLEDRMTLFYHLDFDALDLFGLALRLEKALAIEISVGDALAWRTVGDVVAYAERRALEEAGPEAVSRDAGL